LFADPENPYTARPVKLRIASVLVLVGLSACVGDAAVADVAQPASPEFIVVGSGAGGGPLASRLARAGHRVLLLEAGDDVGGKLKYQVPAMHALSTEDSALAWWYFVKHHTDASIDQTDSKWTPEGILYPRGSALGGSTAVNAMVTVLPSPWDWNRLAELSQDVGFRAANMAPYYDRVREWLSVEQPDPSLAAGDPQVTGFLTAAAQTFSGTQQPVNLSTLLGGDLNAQLSGGETTGLFRLPLATKSGARNGTRELILDTVAKGYPLTVVTGAFVTRVLWDGTTAIGVEYVKASHVYGASLQPQPAPAERSQALASREVILSAGTFNTPQLLMLSGVGDPAQLQALGLDVVVARPGVGKNLQDRYEAPVVHQLAQPVEVLQGCRLGDDANDPCLSDWQQGRGVYQTPGFLASVLMRSSQSTLADLQVFAVPSDARGYYPGYSKDAAEAHDRFTWLLLKAHTHNTDGEVKLKDNSPFTRPDIHFHSYDEADPLHDPDLLALVEGVKFVRQMQRNLHDVTATEIWPGPTQQTDGQLAAWIRKESWGHHACCTDKLGTENDPTAVLDAHFRVIGAQHLRVVDASVFPEIPGTFIALPIFMLSERAADVILEDAR
jgi:choline dehydrogenase